MSNLSLTLSNDEIEEELVNDDLLSTGLVKNETILNKMNMAEKRELLRRSKQSIEFQDEPVSSSLDHSALDTSISNYPSLPLSEKNNSEKKLKLPKTPVSKLINSGEFRNDIIDTKFNLPNCLDDDALPLPMPDRHLRHVRIPYCVMKGENPTSALRRMLADHEKWKAAYISEISKVQSITFEKDVEESTNKEERHSPKHVEKDNENDPYYFDPDDTAQINKVYSDFRKRETNITSNDPVTPNSSKPRTVQRKASRDVDCEEVETVLKPTDPNLGEWIQASSQKSKRNRKRTNNQEKGRQKIVNEVTEVEFQFDNKSLWQRPKSPGSVSLNNPIRSRRNLSNVSEVQEQTVECPICQRRFPQSKVENHAATCEGYSDSPMEVEEG